MINSKTTNNNNNNKTNKKCWSNTIEEYPTASSTSSGDIVSRIQKTPENRTYNNNSTIPEQALIITILKKKIPETRRSLYSQASTLFKEI
jgi:thymidylate synthase